MTQIIGLIALGLFAGGLAATLGVGGGIIFVPALVSLFDFGQLEAQGTSLAIIVPTTIIATIGHARAGRVIWKIAFAAGAAGVAGALVGSRLAYQLDEDVLRRIFAIVLLILAIRMMYRAVHLWREKSAADGSADAAGP